MSDESNVHSAFLVCRPTFTSCLYLLLTPNALSPAALTTRALLAGVNLLHTPCAPPPATFNLLITSASVPSVPAQLESPPPLWPLPHCNLTSHSLAMADAASVQVLHACITQHTSPVGIGVTGGKTRVTLGAPSPQDVKLNLTMVRTGMCMPAFGRKNPAEWPDAWAGLAVSSKVCKNPKS